MQGQLNYVYNYDYFLPNLSAYLGILFLDIIFSCASANESALI